ncbi:hypothetical protein EWB00_003040 [Schistosoma japonicum]|uniref:Uncharacterized protein n=1 Tax=Schistosoma japonicum TaxID=6182 RepID=A0A4Z2DA22_SCHJA|nr:hypothetical protein EWB00_003040 [Schistosoma japonicum]
MPLFSCCGFTNGDDFENSRFTRNDFYQNKEYQDIQYPITCCQLYSNFSIKYPTCSISFNKLNSNFQTGCWDKLNEFILVIRHTMMLVIVGKIGILFILSGLSSLEIIPRKETFVYA